MTTPHIPHEYWDWRCTVLVLTVATTPLLSLTMLAADEPRTIATAADLDGMALALPVCTAAICTYVAWRLSARRALAWLSAGAAIVGLQGLFAASLQLCDSAQAVRQSFWMAVSDGTVLLVVLVVSASLTRPFSGGLAVVGVLSGLALGVLRLVAVARFPVIDAHGKGSWPWALALVVFILPPAWLLGRARSIAVWARWRLAAATALFGIAHLATYLDQPRRTDLGSAVTLACDVGGAVLLAAAAIALLRQALAEGQVAREDLRERLDAMEDGVRRDRARIHEINSTVAGVLSASRLLREKSCLDPDRRRMLGDLVHDELGRLERLVRDPVAIPGPRTVDLDATIRKLALSHQVRGHPVRWLPSGARVTAHPDDVAEVLNILLDNAAKHGSAEANVSVESGVDGVRILVSDTGPGIPPEMRTRLFDWGARGPTSQGQGIGLTIAEELARRQGGYLHLQEEAGQDRPRPGTTFVVGLPAAAGDGHEHSRLA